MADEKTNLDEDALWYKDAVIYELHVKAFKDGSGDGIGDFQGLLEKLDYLEELGITAIWLLPFYPSPLRDDGYDIADYYKINPAYGDIRTFKKVLKEAHKRGLKVITELVLNHTSDQHRWFQRARHAKPGSSFRNYYVWSDDPNKYSETRIIFTDYELSNWSWDPVAKSYYWHRFFSHQPDLNFDNPQVQKEVFKIIDFWLNMGVDGFRLDAIPYLFEREGTNCENLPETHAFLKKLRAHVDKNYKNKLLLAEANMWPEDSAQYFGDGDECHMNYHFPIMPRMFMAVKMEDRYPIIDIIDQTPAIPDTCQWAIFLRNHDELTLEMVTDEERDYMYKVYTKDAQARINLGIRHRLAPLLENNRSKIELLNVLLFSLPGTPVVYYGDEIGMGDNVYLGDRDGVRTPMQWSADRNAGFSDANPHKLYLPVIIDPTYKYESINVETQQLNGSSLLWWTRRIIAMRKRFKAFGRGDIQFLSPANAKIIAYTRSYEEETILVLANLSRFSQAAEIELEAFENHTPVEVFSHNKFPKISEKPYLFTLGPYGYYWLSLQKEKGMDETSAEDDILSGFAVTSWQALFNTKNLRRLESQILPYYIIRCRWFGGKARIIQNVVVKHSIDVPLKEDKAAVLIIEVNYNEGLPELYQLPLSFISFHHEEILRDIDKKGIIARMDIGGTEGMLYDAVYCEEFRVAVFNLMAKKRKLKAGGGELSFYTTTKPAKLKEEKKVNSKILNAEQSNTSITYDNMYFLKLYRKLDNTINPDLEITRYLTEKAKFPHVPKFIGAIELVRGKSIPTVFGMMQELIPNQGDAWQYTRDVIKRYFERVMVRPDDGPEFHEAGNLAEPLRYAEIPPELQQIIGGPMSERAKMLGHRTAEMHIALAFPTEEKDFKPEAFSLHYQRSLFSSLQSLTRSAFQSLGKKVDKLPEEIREEAREVLQMKDSALHCFKRIFAKKINTMKIRTHGDFHLGQVLWTGKDFIIIDFEGEPARPFSERRLKRSPLRDVAGMMRSFHYAAYSTILRGNFAHADGEDMEKWADLWYHYISGFYMHAYLSKVEGINLIPSDKRDFKVLTETYLLEKAIYELSYELNNRPDWVIIPLRGIKSIINRYLDDKK